MIAVEIGQVEKLASSTEVEESLKDWGLIEQLPQEVNGFTRVPGTGIKGQILNIMAYVNEEKHCRLDITYTTETFDYVPVKTIGLHTFRDERFFARDRERFGEMLLKHLPEILKDMLREDNHEYGFEAESLGFEKWDFWRTLPEKIGSFERFIDPEHPLVYLNGSTIFLDYTDFEHGHQIYFSYNSFRNDVFAEMKQHYLPLTTELYDVPLNVVDSKKLAHLEKLIEKHLRNTMQELSKED